MENLISENNSQLRNINSYKQTNNGLISEQKPKQDPIMYNFTFEKENHPLKKETFETQQEGNYKLSEHDFISKNSVPPKHIQSIFDKQNEEYPKYRKGTDIFMEEKETTEIKRKKSPIEKSLEAPKLQESKLIKITKIVAKGFIIAAILAGLVAGGAKIADKISTHIEGEKIKIELVEEFDKKLQKMGISEENLEQFIPQLDKEFIEENLFAFYLKTDNNYEIMKKVANRINYPSFGAYVEDLGYVEIDRDESGITISQSPAFYQYENAMEAKALAEKEAKEKEKQQFEEFNNFSKGAK